MSLTRTGSFGRERPSAAAIRFKTKAEEEAYAAALLIPEGAGKWSTAPVFLKPNEIMPVGGLPQ